MDVLLVEDDSAKAVQIKTLIQGSWPKAILREARSIQSALRSISEEWPDLVILDMSLPTFDPGPDEPGGKPQGFGGREILRRIERMGLRCKVIVVSQFETFGKRSEEISLEELTEQLYLRHINIFIGSVYYNSASDKWKNDIFKIIGEADFGDLE